MSNRDEEAEARMTGRTVTVDYMVPLTVRLNYDTGEVSEVWLHLDSFQSSPPGKFTGPDGNTTCFHDVFFGSDGWPEEVAGKELVAGEHPLVERALELGSRVRIKPAEMSLNFVVED